MQQFILLITCITIITLLTLSCNTTKYTSTDLPEEQLIFGSGGGFAGTVTSFTLLTNGQLFRQHGKGGDMPYEELVSIKKRTAKQLFEKATALSLETKSFQKPGNMYSLLQYKKAEATSHQLTWGHPSFPIIEEIAEFHKELMELVPTPQAPTK